MNIHNIRFKERGILRRIAVGVLAAGLGLSALQGKVENLYANISLQRVNFVGSEKLGYYATEPTFSESVGSERSFARNEPLRINFKAYREHRLGKVSIYVDGVERFVIPCEGFLGTEGRVYDSLLEPGEHIYKLKVVGANSSLSREDTVKVRIEDRLYPEEDKPFFLKGSYKGDVLCTNVKAEPAPMPIRPYRT